MTQADLAEMARRDGAPAADPTDHPALMRRLAVVFLVAHLVAALVAASTTVMLHGDGSWFVFALTLDEPWALKWRSIAARSTAYLVTVVPTGALADVLQLTPIQTAKVNGLIFYGAPGLLFAAAAALVWRRRPDALLFLLLQDLAGFAIGFGFPSEILLAPGFLWIALFSVRPGRRLSLVFVAAYVALVFTHELAAPAALVAAYHAWRRTTEGATDRGRAVGTAVLLGLPILAMLVVRSLGGGAGSNDNALFVVDPRRVLNNPTLWLFVACAPVVYLLARRFPQLRGGLGLCVFALASLLLTFVAAKLAPDLNFADGRYDGRSLIGLSMLALSALFVRAELAATTRSGDAASAPPVDSSLPFIGAAAGVVVASAALFLADWTLASRGMLRAVAPTQAQGGQIQFIPMAQALRLMSPEEAKANARMRFDWVAPYRSFVLADGATPTRVITGDHDYRRFCALNEALHLQPGPYPLAAFHQWSRYACAFVRPPRPDTLSKRLFRRLKGMIG